MILEEIKYYIVINISVAWESCELPLLSIKIDEKMEELKKKKWDRKKPYSLNDKIRIIAKKRANIIEYKQSQYFELRRHLLCIKCKKQIDLNNLNFRNNFYFDLFVFGGLCMDCIDAYITQTSNLHDNDPIKIYFNTIINEVQKRNLNSTLKPNYNTRYEDNLQQYDEPVDYLDDDLNKILPLEEEKDIRYLQYLKEFALKYSNLESIT